jgi:hypothetical protein
MKSLQSKVFWSSDSEVDFYNLVHYTLAYGTYEDCIELVKSYDLKKIREVFLQPKNGLYSRSSLGFAELLLKVKVDSSKYIKNVHSANIR